ncbi:two component transcriptional regulator, LytTR family [Geosporobacter subterraneus DSM 17957]|uniref:Stage 0 sporulation protein A homolog n=1 Tax=Geosporobacter subterraneus DSM 17957 TaxID=1121919 RepID=A0A1M6JYI8_9FIRM|nr:LytTR family transcriptional regulator DNA-binding domain-containing protein [Geosporobacter subterraneus]SHJ51767.1 two component transcriptional regulator, LytTR family [Geosporobacter subterraneus DSM 17957]
MRCIIVDDEAPAREEIKYLLDNLKGYDIEIVGEAGDGRTAFEMIKNQKPDLVLLDIQMRGISGFDLANEVLQLENSPFIVFITAFDQYAIKAFEINAVDYILKPISANRLSNTISRVYGLLKQYQKTEGNIEQLLRYLAQPKTASKICVYSNGKHIPLDPEDIIFIGVDGRNSCIKSKKGVFSSNLTLVEFEEKLKSSQFFRCHRSYLININEIQEIDNWFNGTYQITMNGYTKDKIPVSRSNANKFRAMMNI